MAPDVDRVTRRGFLIACGLTAAGCGPAMNVARTSVAGDPYRLPSTVVPKRYELRIAPDFASRRFGGRVVIDVAVGAPVTEIILNASELTISEASIRDASGRALAGTVTLDKETERARIRFAEALAPGPWRLALAFAGPLGESLRGFYRVRAGEGDGGTERALAITQFQAADARRAFPCWDEPAFKAVFDVTLVVDRRLVALSNAAVAAEEPTAEAGARAVRFAPTVPMSTYLVAFVVGDLEATPPRTVDGVPIRVWALPGRVALAGYGLDVAAFALHFLREFFGVPYPGDKLDLIGVPDFASGAMENLGAVIFRETNVLVDERRASLGELRSVADNIAHEVAHMWFGDLVTMTWWDGLWLNEAFATFMALLVVDAWRPAWQRWSTFAVARTDALEIDGLAATRPVEFAVQTPEEAESMFDALTYKKGAAILRMMERHLGAEVFRRGVRAYLTEHRFANAETGHLWTALGEASGHPVGAVMDTWVHRAGYPLVSVALAPDGRTVVLSQQRFRYLRGAGEAGPGEVWRVPVHVRAKTASGARSVRRVLSAAETRVELPGPPRWVVMNADGDGFYRTRYSAALLSRLAADLHGVLSPIERLVLVDDTWAVTLAGLSPVSEYLDLTARFRGEDDRNVWSVVLEGLTTLERVVVAEDRPALAALVRDRVGPAVAALGASPAPGEAEVRRELRADLLRALGTLGDDRAAQAEARRLAGRYREDPAAVDASLAAAAIAVTAHAGGEAEYAAFLEQFRTTPSPQDRWRYLFALARFREPAMVRRTQQMTLEGTIRPADGPYALRQMLLTVDARESTWRFVVEHWDAFAKRFTQAGLATLCEGLVGLATPELERSVREFFAARRISLGGNTLERELERLRIAVSFREREAAALHTYLSRGSSG
jgi:puromycin-sensitive aminopeptidase